MMDTAPLTEHELSQYNWYSDFNEIGKVNTCTDSSDLAIVRWSTVINIYTLVCANNIDGKEMPSCMRLEYDYTIAGTALNGEVINFGYGTPPPGWTNNVTLTGPVPFAPAGVAVIVPEPMTIVLLGLGGLFLRRRK